MGSRRTIRIKCSRNLCESESVINTIIYSLLIWKVLNLDLHGALVLDKCPSVQPPGGAYCLTLKSLLAMTCFGYSSIKIDKYSNTTAIDRGKVQNNFHMVHLKLDSLKKLKSSNLRNHPVFQC